MVFKLNANIRNQTLGLGLVFALSTSLVQSQEEGAFYRYKNDEGVTVLDTSIPPEYAQRGYEIVSKTLQVIEVVPPAPSDEEIAQKQSEDEIWYHFEQLRKRYSDVASIESARKRRLENLQTSISILKGNITTLQNQLDAQMNQAATHEREGKNVPAQLLKQIANSRAELTVANELLEIRLDEQVEINEKFDKDIEYFVKGQAMLRGSYKSGSTLN